MTGQGGPGHAADDAGGDDAPLPVRLCTTLIRCHCRNLPALALQRHTAGQHDRSPAVHAETDLYA